jgi:hypothetical protein
LPTAEASQDTKRYEATEHGIDDIIRFLREIGKDVPIATE